MTNIHSFGLQLKSRGTSVSMNLKDSTTVIELKVRRVPALENLKQMLLVSPESSATSFSFFTSACLVK